MRNSHLQIPGLNESGRGQNEKFITPLGPLLYPADPDGTAANVINCRCAVFARIVSAGLLKFQRKASPVEAVELAAFAKVGYMLAA